MYYLLYAFILSCLLYWILQTRDDESARREGREPATLEKRVMLFFFLVIVLTCVCFFLNNAMQFDGNSKMMDGGSDAELQAVKLEPNYKNTMIKNINEDVMIGMPGFVATMSNAG